MPDLVGEILNLWKLSDEKPYGKSNQKKVQFQRLLNNIMPNILYLNSSMPKVDLTFLVVMTDGSVSS